MTPRVHIRLALYTDHGPCGNRLERSVPLPTHTFAFEDSPEGRKAAEIACEQMNAYCEKYLAVPKKKETAKNV